MNNHDDTKLRTVRVVAPLADGHFVALREDGTKAHGITYEHAESHHPELIGEIEMCRIDTGHDSATVGSTAAYRAGWERIFGRTPVGEA